jgi:hypothetical protein
VPTPVALRQGQVRVADKGIFERLDAYSTPRQAEYHDADPCRVDFRRGDELALRHYPPPPPMAAPVAPAAARSELH